MPNQLIIQVPPKIKPIFSSQHRFIDLYGGRGSSKSWSIGMLFIVKGYQQKRRYLCTREYQNTIKESVYRLLANTIERFKLSSFYKITDDSIKGRNGTEFIFKGLRKDPDGIKSMEDLDAAWVEEAHTTSRKSLDILIPTVRKKGSQIIFSYNPTNEDDPVHEDYTKSNKPNVLRINCNYSDNPFFPQVLKDEMEWDRANDPDKYFHIWEGQCLKHSEAQVFYGKWIIDDFEASKDVWFYFGSDFGYGQDPATLNRCFVVDNKLYIDYEFHGIKTDIDKLPDAYKTIPESQNYPITGDSSRPDTINYIRQRGFPKIKSSIKGKGSIEDGIAFMRSFDKIIIHPRCKNTIDEFRLYSYVVDPKTGQISNKLEDKQNHHIDSCIAEGTLILTGRGKIKIEDVQENDIIFNRYGWHKVNHAWKNGLRNIYELKLQTGHKLLLTEDHKIFVNDDFKRLDNIRYADEISLFKGELKIWHILKWLFTIMKNISGILNQKEGQTGFTSNQGSWNSYTVKYIQIILEKYLKDMLFITLTIIPTIIIFLIYGLCFLVSMLKYTIRAGLTISNISKKSDRLPKNGINQKKGWNGIKNILKSWLTQLRVNLAIKLIYVNAVKESLSHAHYMINFAPTNVNQNIDGHLVLMTFKKYVNIVERLLRRINIVRPYFVGVPAQIIQGTRIKKFVYDLEIDKVHEYSANGIIVSNCRYALEDLMRDRRVRISANPMG